jgi:methyl-accepting chemotaxis protein
VPLADLQQLTGDFQAYTVHGLVVGLGAVTGQLEAVQQQLQLKAASKEATAADLKALAAHIPADLAGRVATISADWDDMVTEDAAYQAAAAANSPDARAASQAATAAYLKLEQDVNGLTDTLLADEAASREAIGARFAAARTITLALLAVGVLLAVGLGILLARDIRNRIVPVRAAAEALASGDLTDILDSTSEDELGQLSAALSQGMGWIREMVAGVVGSAGAMTTLVGDLTRATVGVVDASRSGLEHAQTVSGTATAVSGNVAQLATGAEEMTASIRDISRSARQAAGVADDAVRIVASTNTTLTQLGNSSAEIGNVIKVITGIAEQTDLLALNATIEAARRRGGQGLRRGGHRGEGAGPGDRQGDRGRVPPDPGHPGRLRPGGPGDRPDRADGGPDQRAAGHHRRGGRAADRGGRGGRPEHRRGRPGKPRHRPRRRGRRGVQPDRCRADRGVPDDRGVTRPPCRGARGAGRPVHDLTSGTAAPRFGG